MMSVKKKALAAVGGLSCLVLPAWAQQEADPDRGATPVANLERVEVRARSAQGDELRKRSSVAKQVYGKEELERFGDSDLAAVARRLPGVRVQDGEVQLRGFGVGYSQILLNGEPAPVGFNLSQLSTEQVERIEVVKAATAEYGAQAMGGTLNIILKNPPLQLQRSFKLGVNSNGGHPYLTTSGTLGGSKGAWRFSVPVSVYQWALPVSTTTRVRRHAADGEWSVYTTQAEDVPKGYGFNTSPRVVYRIDDDQTLTFQGFFVVNSFRNAESSTSTLQEGSPPESVRDLFRQRGRFSTWKLGGQYDSRIDDNTQLELRLSTADGGPKTSTSFDGVDAAGTPSVDRRTSASNQGQVHLGSGRVRRLVGEAQTVTVGVELEYKRRRLERRTEFMDLDTGTWTDLLPSIEGRPYHVSVDRAAAFVQDEWELGKSTNVNLGLRTERIDTRASAPDGGTQGNRSQVVTPLIHLTQKLGQDNKDLLRLSVTRTFRSPNLDQLMARPTINTNYPTSGGNTEGAPDRIGNPALKPELAVGADLAYEHYLTGGGIVSIGGFHRRINDVVRNVIRQESVGWAAAPRWVSRPENLSRARASGLELEVKGRASDLLPAALAGSKALNLRGAFSRYWSEVLGVPGPGNRIEQQPAWSATLGMDYRWSSWPLSTGLSWTATPTVSTRVNQLQMLRTIGTRSFDAFALWKVSDLQSWRLAVNNFFPQKTGSQIVMDNGDFSSTEFQRHRSLLLQLEMKL